MMMRTFLKNDAILVPAGACTGMTVLGILIWHPLFQTLWGTGGGGGGGGGGSAAATSPHFYIISLMPMRMDIMIDFTWVAIARNALYVPFILLINCWLLSFKVLECILVCALRGPILTVGYASLCWWSLTSW